MAYYHYKVKVGIFVANVQAETWPEAVKKVMESDLFDKTDTEAQLKCIEVRRIRNKKED